MEDSLRNDFGNAGGCFGIKLPLVRRLGLAACLAGAASSVQGAQQYFTDQPAGKHSTLVDRDGVEIPDVTFATWASGLLQPGGVSDSRNASFLFSQCYSGGMFDDLASRLGANVSWVGGSSAGHGTYAYSNEGIPYTLSYWVGALKPELVPGQTMFEAVYQARVNDPKGPGPDNGTGYEYPQVLHRNGGDSITVDDPGAGGHHAILWAGFADRASHAHGIRVVYDKLHAAWAGQPDVSFIVLGDPGTLNLPNFGDITYLPATRANLQQAFLDLQSVVGPDDQFVFFGSNHGGLQTAIIDPLKFVHVGGRQSTKQSLKLYEAEVAGARQSGMATLSIEFAWDDLALVGDTADVYLGGEWLGSIVLDPELDAESRRFAVDASWLDTTFLPQEDYRFELLSDTGIEVVNRSERAGLTLTGMTFFTGPVSEPSLEVPEPGTIAAGFGVLGLAVAMLRRARRGGVARPGRA